MRHKLSGNHLGRSYNQAKALYRNLVFSLLDLGRVQTTHAKAKAVVGLVDRVVNLAKKNNINARRQVIKILGSDQKIDKIFAEIAPKLTDRNSGYTRIIRLGPRFSDTADMVYLELINFGSEQVAPERAKLPEKIAEETPTKKAIKTTKKSLKSPKKLK